MDDRDALALVTSDDAFAKLEQTLEASVGNAAILGVDTEFIRERTYNARLCLVQVSGTDCASCIDPFEFSDLGVITKLFSDDSVLKLFHAARQDLEVLYQRLGFVVGPVFDTQIAAAMCGYGDQVGYAALVERVTGVALAKEETRTDWSQRPLTGAQIQYALDDVRHLHDLHDDLSDTLDGKGRLQWLDEENAALGDPALYVVEPEDAWRRVKGVASQDPDTQHRIAMLAAWRERMAQERDLPREWVIRDRALVEMARELPRDGSALENIEDIGRRTVDRYGDTLLEMLNQAVPDDANHLARSTPRPDAAFNAMRKKLMAHLRERAEEERIAPSLLGNRDTVERFIRSPDDSRLLQGWRRALIGESMLELRNAG